jgi:hypothetical protein
MRGISILPLTIFALDIPLTLKSPLKGSARCQKNTEQGDLPLSTGRLEAALHEFFLR